MEGGFVEGFLSLIPEEFQGSFSSDIKFFDGSSLLVKEFSSEKKVPETHIRFPRKNCLLFL